MSDATQVLHAITEGDPRAASQLLTLVYDELRTLAAHRLAHQTPGQTLQPTALVHEAYLRLVGGDAQGAWEGRDHFYAACAEALRHILVDKARRTMRPQP
jgi:RNA polymerase sigma factor (TIGR02999 family)